MTGNELLSSWNEGAAKSAIIEFVERTAAGGVPVEERIAAFDADGTLWCEKPAPVEVDFLLRRLAEMAKADPRLRDRQPWKAAYAQDGDWFDKVIKEHYAGDETNVKTLLGGVTAAYAGISVEDFQAQSDKFLRSAQNLSLGCAYLHIAYVPMIELLRYLEANGFSNHMVSGSGADFMRPISQELFGIPAERVIGSSTALSYSSDSAERSPARQPSAFSTTGRRSRCRSGAASAAGRSSPAGTRTATSRCSTSPITTTGPRFACSSCTTMRSASSTTRAAPSRH